MINATIKLSLGKPKTMYLHVTGPKPRVVTVVHSLGKTEDGNLFGQIGYAVCNREFDSFNKKVGRKIAEGRMNCARTALVIQYPKEATTWNERMAFLLQELKSSLASPKRLSKPVAQYLAQQSRSNA